MSITHLERRADLSYTADNHQFRTRFLSFQTVDDSIVPNDIPYKQLPQLSYSYQRLLPEKGFNAIIPLPVAALVSNPDLNGRSVEGPGTPL